MHKCMGKISKAEFPQAGPFCLSEVKYDSPNIMLDYVRKCMADETQSNPVSVSYGETSAGGPSISKKGVQFEDNPE